MLPAGLAEFADFWIRAGSGFFSPSASRFEGAFEFSHLRGMHWPLALTWGAWHARGGYLPLRDGGSDGGRVLAVSPSQRLRGSYS